ncbi:hypothetical protein ABTM51_20760, partial [Acinetobacter baumannii]
LLVGVTHIHSDGTVEQEQFVGTCSIEDRETYCLVNIDCSDGERRSYPFDARALERANHGEYRLRSTGEIVRNPDFLMTWEVSKGI